MEESIVTGLSIRKKLLQRVEAERGDISRSRFLSRLIEQGLDSRTENKGKAKVVPNQVKPSVPAAAAYASAGEEMTT